MGVLDGTVAVITGSGRARGMGEASALKLAEEGAAVVVTDICQPYAEDLGNVTSEANAALGSKGHLDDLVGQIEAAGGRALGVCCDVASRDDVERLVVGAIDAFGRLDILVNCAATTVGTGPFLDIPEPAWDKTFAVNAKGPFYTMRAAIPEMRKVGGGKIVNVVTSFSGGAGYGAYIASKAALWSMTEAVAQEFAPENILVNSITPGWVATQMGEHELAWFAREKETSVEHVEREISGSIPRGRRADALDIANLILFLVSPANDYIVGQNIKIDGGFDMTRALEL